MKKMKVLDSLRNSRQPIPKERIFKILNLKFAGYWDYGSGRGSHCFRIIHPKLVNHFMNGVVNIPVSHGQKVEPQYIDKILLAMSIIEKEDEQEPKSE